MKNILLPLILVVQCAAAQDNDFRSYYAKAMEAYKAKSYPQFYKLIKEANALHPWHQGIQYQVGVAAALTNHKAEAFDNLKKAILTDTRFRIEGLADFNNIKESPAFKQLIGLQNEWSRPVIHSDTALVIKDRTLHCEGLEYDTPNATFYVGSIRQRKIVKITNGVATDFCPPEFEGMTSIFGLKIDPAANVLWACASPMKEMEHYDSTASSGVYKFDLATGKLLSKIMRPSSEKGGVFGDLTINKKGEVYVSDSQSNTIFFVNQQTHQLESFFSSPELWNMQGITFGDNEKYIFISDYIKGLYRLNTQTKALTKLECALDISLKGIDGLSYHRNTLIAVQNGVYPLRAVRLSLNTLQDQITSFEIIDRGHPAFNEPTLGIVHGDTFYYIANSQWEGYGPNHQIKSADQLQDIVILRYALKR